MFDNRPRPSLTDQSLFGRKMCPRVIIVSCGGANRISTQHASKNVSSGAFGASFLLILGILVRDFSWCVALFWEQMSSEFGLFKRNTFISLEEGFWELLNVAAVFYTISIFWGQKQQLRWALQSCEPTGMYRFSHLSGTSSINPSSSSPRHSSVVLVGLGKMLNGLVTVGQGREPRCSFPLVIVLIEFGNVRTISKPSGTLRST